MSDSKRHELAQTLPGAIVEEHNLPIPDDQEAAATYEVPFHKIRHLLQDEKPSRPNRSRPLSQ